MFVDDTTGKSENFKNFKKIREENQADTQYNIGNFFKLKVRILFGT